MEEQIKSCLFLNGLENICFFSDKKYDRGDFVFLCIGGESLVYEIYDKPHEQKTEIQTYYARKF